MGCKGYYLFVFPLQCGQQPSNIFSSEFRSLTKKFRATKTYGTQTINIYVKYAIDKEYEHSVTLELNSLS